MIDHFDITIDGDDFPVLGKEFTTKQPSGVESKSFTEVKVSVTSDAPLFRARVETKQKRMRFKGSPAQFLQGHNGVVVTDLQPLVKASVLLVFGDIGRDVPSVR